MRFRHGSRIAPMMAILWFCFGLTPGALKAASKLLVPLQPFSDGVREVERELAFYGQPLLPADQQAIDNAFANPDGAWPESTSAGSRSHLSFRKASCPLPARLMTTPGRSTSGLLHSARSK